jgi:predicted ABC-type ATPase
VDEFVNADTLAQGLSAFRPEDVAVEAGRIILKRLDDLESQRRSFAFESTLSSHALAKRLARLQQHDYRVHLVYLWLPTADLAVARVAERVRVGGHDVPADVVRRRFAQPAQLLRSLSAAGGYVAFLRRVRNGRTAAHSDGRPWRSNASSRPANLAISSTGVRQ